MSNLKLIAIAAALTLSAAASQANGPAGYDPLAFVQADIARDQAAAKAAPMKLVPKLAELRKIVHPVAQGNGAAGYDPLAFVKADAPAATPTQPERAPIVAAKTTK